MGFFLKRLLDLDVEGNGDETCLFGSLVATSIATAFFEPQSSFPIRIFEN